MLVPLKRVLRVQLTSPAFRKAARLSKIPVSLTVVALVFQLLLFSHDVQRAAIDRALASYQIFEHYLPEENPFRYLANLAEIQYRSFYENYQKAPITSDILESRRMYRSLWVKTYEETTNFSDYNERLLNSLVSLLIYTDTIYDCSKFGELFNDSGEWTGPEKGLIGRSGYGPIDSLFTSKQKCDRKTVQQLVAPYIMRLYFVHRLPIYCDEYFIAKFGVDNNEISRVEQEFSKVLKLESIVLANVIEDNPLKVKWFRTYEERMQWIAKFGDDPDIPPSRHLRPRPESCNLFNSQ